MSKPNFPEVPVDVSAGQRFLTITVDMRAICAVSDPYPGYEVEITDTSNAATSLVDALVDEKEDGTTLVHELVDAAIRKLIDNGGEGFNLIDDEHVES